MENPLKYAKQHPKQIEAMHSDRHIRVLFWGNRVGKTEWGAQEVARYVLGQHPSKEVTPPVEVWCACPSFELQEETTQKKLLRYIPQSAILHVDKLRGDILRSIKLKNGSIITFKSYEQGREKFQGVGKRLIWFDEEPPFDIWDECSVREEAGQMLDIIMTMTPIKGMTWVYDQLYTATSNQDLFISEAEWDDNPWLSQAQKDKMANGRTPESLQVRRKGQFVKRVGLICNWWGRSIHIKHYETLDRSWTWYEVGDGGFNDPFAYLLIGVDHDDNVHVVNGFREPGLLTKEIKSRRSRIVSDLTITAGFADNDNPRLLLELSQRDNSDPEDHPFTLKAIEKVPGEGKSWDEYLAEKLAQYGTIQKGTGQPRLYISDNLVRFDEKTGNKGNWLQQEIENLSWKEVISKQGSEIKPEWDDHRRFGHHFDGIRALAYFLVSYKKPTSSNSRPPAYKPRDSVIGI